MLWLLVAVLLILVLAYPVAALPVAAAILAAHFIEPEALPARLSGAADQGEVMSLSGAPAAAHVRRTVPQAANAVGRAVEAGEPLGQPASADAVHRFLPRSRHNLREQQREDFHAHLRMRRDQAWQSTHHFPKEAREQYELARRRQEREIALSLRPSKNMIIEDTGVATTHPSDQPFAAILSDNHVWHSAHFRQKAGESGSLAGLLRTRM